MKFVNQTTGEVLSHQEFVLFMWEEAERQFTDCHEGENWNNLTKAEQIEQYCEQFEHQLKDRNYRLLFQLGGNDYV